MSDAEVKDLNHISKKDISHTPSGKYIQFIHDHSKKTFDVWKLLPDGITCCSRAKLLQLSLLKNLGRELFL